MNSEKTIDDLLLLTDGRKHLICVPYTIDNLHMVAKKLGLSSKYFDKTMYKIPDEKLSNIEDKCEFVSSQTLNKTIYQFM